MAIRERISNYGAVTDEGDFIPLADVTDGLPASNEWRIARMHPHRDYDSEIEEYEATIHDLDTKRSQGAHMFEAAVNLTETFEPQDAEVIAMRDARDARRASLLDQGLGETRTSNLLAREFGAAIAKLAQKGHDIEPIVGRETPIDKEAIPPHISILHTFEDTEPRERDARERQAGPDN
jgi:hypothetical protein